MAREGPGFDCTSDTGTNLYTRCMHEDAVVESRNSPLIRTIWVTCLRISSQALMLEL